MDYVGEGQFSNYIWVFNSVLNLCTRAGEIYFRFSCTRQQQPAERVSIKKRSAQSYNPATAQPCCQWRQYCRDLQHQRRNLPNADWGTIWSTWHTFVSFFHFHIRLSFINLSFSRWFSNSTNPQRGLCFCEVRRQLQSKLFWSKETLLWKRRALLCNACVLGPKMVLEKDWMQVWIAWKEKRKIWSVLPPPNL